MNPFERGSTKLFIKYFRFFAMRVPLFPFYCHWFHQLNLSLKKESSIKAKSTKKAAQFSSFIRFILVLKPFKCLQNFPRFSRETSRGTHAFVLPRMLRQNSHLFCPHCSQLSTTLNNIVEAEWRVTMSLTHC